MPVLKSHYEELLATYSQSLAVVDLFKGYRVYLEMIPSMRRAQESVITVPLPIVRLRHSEPSPHGHGTIRTMESVMLPCDIGVILSDPEWQIKTGREIFIFIHRPDEDFSELLARWRQTQVLLGQDYEWLLPSRYQHLMADAAEKVHPLFVLFAETPERIRKGLQGAGLPYVMAPLHLEVDADPITIERETTLGALLAEETQPAIEDELTD
ncbi:hypothetical protein IQ266_15620 [filamentous cyanobacterium LEGE 11480]|uniref:Uncharacterized protein n=1 Tax=Romeriopsis navalis LEGE 11480 TaxID=2777977 RepID=A0A928VNZ1_9CYAN|nr:hypothetical protein [Romeriopsis navalis]MBE9031163.1 hypothetical protein [Romeriopsis navalis LEGE 11480]